MRGKEVEEMEGSRGNEIIRGSEESGKEGK